MANCACGRCREAPRAVVADARGWMAGRQASRCLGLGRVFIADNMRPQLFRKPPLPRPFIRRLHEARNLVNVNVIHADRTELSHVAINSMFEEQTTEPLIVEASVCLAVLREPSLSCPNQLCTLRCCCCNRCCYRCDALAIWRVWLLDASLQIEKVLELVHGLPDSRRYSSVGHTRRT